MAGKIIACKCCVAGGGPAVMMLGVLLARAGVSITVLEKHSDFLRDFRGDYWQAAYIVPKGSDGELKRTRIEDFRVSIENLVPFLESEPCVTETGTSSRRLKYEWTDLRNGTRQVCY